MSVRVPAAIFDCAHNSFIEKYNTQGRSFDVNVVRVIISLFFIWKLLSRDFGFYGTVPAGVFPFYPINIYPAESYALLTGLPLISEIATFHWIHLLLPYPGETGLRIIQGIAIGLLVLQIVVGRGPRRGISIATYCVLTYLWGYLFLGGHEVDSLLLYFGLQLIIVCSNYADEPIYRIGRLASHPRTLSAGHAISLMYLLFATYYFASGINKLTDISFLEWFQFDLSESLHEFRIRADHGYTSVPLVFEPLYNATWLNYIGPPMVYISHLLAPMVFYWRKHVYKFFAFYALFHFLSFGVGISFTGYVFVWLVLFPWHSLIFRWRSETESPLL